MTQYSKLTLVDFKKKLQDGGYSGLTGVRRAIGKVQGWSEAEREKARKIAEGFYGEEGGKAAAAPKKAAKKPGRKPGKKAAKAEAKKKASKPEVAAAAPKKRGRKPKAVVGDTVVSTSAVERTPVNSGAIDRDASGVLSQVVGTMSEAIKTMKLARDMSGNPSDYDSEINRSVKLLGRAIATLDERVVSPLRTPQTTGAVTVAADKPKIKRTPVVKTEEPKVEEVKATEEEIDPEQRRIGEELSRTAQAVGRFPPGKRPLNAENMERVEEESNASAAPLS